MSKPNTEIRDIAFVNPSYNRRLSAGERMRDFLGAYHLILNGVVLHEMFDLRNEGKPDEMCDTEDRKRVVEFVELLVKDALASQKKQWIEEIKGKDRKEHICRFNDGEQNCDCYFEGIDDVLSLLENK